MYILEYFLGFVDYLGAEIRWKMVNKIFQRKTLLLALAMCHICILAAFPNDIHYSKLTLNTFIVCKMRSS